MKKIIVIVLCLFSLSSFAVSLSCTKVRAVNSGGSASQTKIFRDCWSRHFYEIKLTNASVADTNHVFTIKVLPILKGCKNGSAFPYFPGVIEETEIKLDPKKGFVCVYVSPLVKWTRDTWTDVGGDWSKGIVNNTVFIELLRDNSPIPVKVWTNCSMPMVRNTKSIDDCKDKIPRNYMSWLEEKVDQIVKDSNLIEEGARIECIAWSKFKK